VDDALVVWTAPEDGPRLWALGAAVLVLFGLPRLLTGPRRQWLLVGLAAAAAAALSAGYITYYLRGGPRIIDATSYWLQARALSEGWLAWPLSEPEHAVLGRFLLRSPLAHPLGLEGASGEPGVAVIFPPGYPAVLALGFVAGWPMAVGPLLAAALVGATAALAKEVARSAAAVSPRCASSLSQVAPLAAALSALCATLRYHTADTTSHGMAALCMTVGLAAALRALDPEQPRRHLAALVAGGAAGWLAATRPVTALALGLVLTWLVARPMRSSAGQAPLLRLGGLFALGALPGLGLWLAHQYAATGSPFSTAQHVYYALSDGPAGCFAFGFGGEVGCQGEHAAFVRDNLPDGYGPLEALATTGRRLVAHLSDPLNFAPLFGLVVGGAWLWRRAPAVRALGLAAVLQVLLYAGFYFDGTYPGGGARMFADVLPLEHVLAALCAVTLGSQPRGHPHRARQAAGWAAALLLVGFAVGNGRQHALLRDREGGRPMFEPKALAGMPLGHALLFLDTDHGFNLAYDPASSSPAVARYHGDGLDRLAWESHGRPRAYRYRYDPSPPSGGLSSVSVEPLGFDPRPVSSVDLHIEGESLWPAAAQEGGWAWPEWASHPCASAGRWLRFRPTERGRATLRLRLPHRLLGGRRLVPRLYLEPAGSPPAEVTLELRVDGRKTYQWSFRAPASSGCQELEAAVISPDPSSIQLVLQSPVTAAIDRLRLPRP